MELSKFFGYDVFKMAICGLENTEVQNKDVLTIIDFSKPSTEERLFVLDVLNHKVLFASHVAHGRNSGWNYATSFSNKSGSHKSSLGFYLTGETYTGRNGYSLVLHGLEKGFNDNAYERAVVIHGADYCDPALISEDGRLGRSFGCPALPRAVNDAIINTIKDGSLLFIYANEQNYIGKSKILN
ncbi:murein L,D-transpeptidase catalytic domain family protein [Bacteroidales bacterium OttesenSCG-928-B11]|nr:murein L,D-transpeptidase catalytic domain family protein [Bacteroidales bacterium OttesenSCG-928-E04]MDL2312271.1 murein L,D-transpeptidase catalytic domain family protein [Bacteroidales bacterium OttesenSCG-928-B11]